MRARNDLLRSSSIRHTSLVYPPHRIPQHHQYQPTPHRRCRLHTMSSLHVSYHRNLLLSTRTQGIKLMLKPTFHGTWRLFLRRPSQRTCRDTTPGGPWSTTRQTSALASVALPLQKRLKCTALELDLPARPCMGASRCRRATSHLTSSTSLPNSCRRCATRCCTFRQRSRTCTSGRTQERIYGPGRTVVAWPLLVEYIEATAVDFSVSLSRVYVAYANFSVRDASSLCGSSLFSYCCVIIF